MPIQGEHIEFRRIDLANDGPAVPDPASFAMLSDGAYLHSQFSTT